MLPEPHHSESPKPDPKNVLALLYAFRLSKTMFDAVSLGVFDALAERPHSAAALATRLELSTDGLERLLDACVGLKLLVKNGSEYTNTPEASVYLCRHSPDRLTGYVNYSNDVMWSMWGNLKSAVREGTNRWKQTFGWDGPLFSHFYHTEDALREFLMGMHGFGRLSSPHVAAAFDLGAFRHLVDLGGGTGHLAIAACERWPQLSATIFDLGEVLPLAREIVGASAVADRIRFQSGDFFEDPLPEADLFSLGRILHDWTEPKILRLLSRVYERLPRGGGLLIAEKLLEDDKSGPSWAQMQGLNMLICTEGKERTLSEYAELLHKVGFRGVRGSRNHSPLDAVLATKP
jgi:acetylserotonin O-methyltransferase